MKLVSEGKEVQYQSDMFGWYTFKEGSHVTEYQLKKWRLKSTPVKYSVDIWLEHEPIHKSECDELKSYLFGNNSWNNVKSYTCNKKYKITVESVEQYEKY